MKHFGCFALDTGNECLWRGGVQIDLSPKPFAVLRYLVEHAGRLITHDELLDALWPEIFVQPQVLRTYMLDLRKVLEDDAKQPRYIQTLPKRGYRFVSPVTEGDGAAAARPAGLPSNGAPAQNIAGIVDRDEERARLGALAQLAFGGQRQTVFLTGETGIGKTALTDAFCQLQESTAGAVVARGQCVRGFGHPEDYYPVMEALGRLCAQPHSEAACRVLARVAPAWLAALGREAAEADSSVGSGLLHERASERASERKLADLCAALEDIASEAPLVLVFEDLHWADNATLDLVSALARRRTPARLLMLATMRPREAAAPGPLKAMKHDLLMRKLGAEIAIAPLTKAALKDLLNVKLERDAPAWLTDFVHRQSEGNPLFAIAILEHLIARGALAGDGANGMDGASHDSQTENLEAAIPDELAQMIELEIEGLSAAEQHILEAGSLMRVAFPAWAVAAALEQDAGEIEEMCDELARRLHFVCRAGEDELPNGTRSTFYVFSHDLFREVLMRRQPAARRAARHVRVAERLGTLFAGREASVSREMAMHYEAAGDWLRASDALRAAAAHARERCAFAEAEDLAHHALRLAGNLDASARAAVHERIHAELGGPQELAAAGRS